MGRRKVYTGTSGYMYRHWGGGVFYPAGANTSMWLEFYSRKMNSVELNTTFYGLPEKHIFSEWYRRTPKRFRFALKGSRFITHIKRLINPAEGLKMFFSRADALQEKLSAVLWQFPPRFGLNLQRLQKFCTELKKESPCRQVIEFRNKSWFCEDVYEILRDADICTCMADWPHPAVNIPETADFIYMRRHGAEGKLYGGCYSEKQLQEDASYIKSKNKDCYIYFNNDSCGWAPKNALRLQRIMR